MNKVISDYMERNGYKFTSIDLFSGPGGLSTGFKWAGIYPLIAVEWTESTAKTYCLNHDADLFDLEQYLNDSNYIFRFLKETYSPVLIKGDIHKVDISLILELLKGRYGVETVDIVSGGAPCESFSLAGKRKNQDPRDGLFKEIIRISKAIQPEIILFENVKGLLSKKIGKGSENAIDYICREFEDTKSQPYYHLASKDEEDFVLNAADYGVPQIRERIILISFKDKERLGKFHYPVPYFNGSQEKPYLTVAEALYDLPIVHSKEECKDYKFPTHYVSENQKRYLEIMRNSFSSSGFNNFLPEYLTNGLGDKLSSHKGPGHIARKLKLLENIRKGESMKTAYQRIEKEGRMNELGSLFPKTIYASRNRRLIEDKPSFTVTSHCLDEMIHPFLNRAITPREAARLQSFPDWYDFIGPYVAFHSSPEQDRYEQIGDAVPPLLAYAIGKELVSSLSTS